MTAIPREITRLEGTLQSWREVDNPSAFSPRSWVVCLQFLVVTTILLGFVRPRSYLIGIGGLLARGRSAHFRRNTPLTGRVNNSAIKWNCRRNEWGDGECN